MPSNIVITPASGLIAFTSSSGNTQNITQNSNGTITFSGATAGVGIGVVPSTWASGTENTLQVKNSSIYEYGGYETALSVNAYYNAGWKYIGTNTATQLQLSNGALNFKSAVSGIAGNAITWTTPLTLDSTGPATFSSTISAGGTVNMSGTSVTSIYTDARVRSAVSTSMVGYGVRMVGLSPVSGSYTIGNMYAIKTSTPVVQPNVTVTNSYGVYIGRTDDPESGGIVTNKYALVTESTAGNFGIGTTSPSAKLDVYAGADTTSNLVLWGQIIRNEGNAATTGYGAGLKLKISSDGEPYKWAGIAAVAGTGYSNRTDLALYTAASSTADAIEKVRITGDGNVLIGTSSDSGRKLQVEASTTTLLLHNTNNTSGTFCNIWQLGGGNTDNTSSYYLYCDTDFIGVRAVIYGNGNMANVNNSYGAYSDIKLKENIVDATPKLDDLLKVKIRNYNLKGEETKQIGVVAQELEEIFPSMIDESIDTEKNEETGEVINLGTTTKSVKYSVFVPILIKGMQEQQTQIQALLARIEILENK